jgi:acyl-coenzyme A thioesterase PaaI-like protein
VWEARLRFDARVVNRSKNTAYLECDITDHDGKRIAKAASTCTVLRGDQAKAR